MKQKQILGGHLIGCSLLALSLVLIALLFPSCRERAQATDAIAFTNENMAPASTTYHSVEDSLGASDHTTPRAAETTPTVSITIPATLNFDSITPTAAGETTTATASLKIETSASDGYSLYLYASDDGSLRNQNPHQSAAIQPTAQQAISLEAMTQNTWGYSLSTTTPGSTTVYSGIPTANLEPIMTQDTSATGAANDSYSLSLGAKVDTSIPSGTYTGTVMITVVAQPQAIIFDGITTMQEMTTDICSRADVGDTENSLSASVSSKLGGISIHCVHAR